jgi:hypothetical protein
LIFCPAGLSEADAVCTVLSRSIEDLCSIDHGGDLAILGLWLANKAPEHVTAWIDPNPIGFIVGVGPDGIVGVGSVVASGEIQLNYVAPSARFTGVSKGLLHAMENHVDEGILPCGRKGRSVINSPRRRPADHGAIRISPPHCWIGLVMTP